MRAAVVQPDRARDRQRAGAVRLALCLGLLGTCAIATANAADASVQLGLARYHTVPKGGLSADAKPPVAEYVTGSAVGKAAPTNQWYSSVMFQRWSQVIHAHPMTYRATEAGFEVGLPAKTVATVDGSRETRYAHQAAITVAPLAFKPRDARLAGFSDWLARISMAEGGQSLEVTVLHGSPFSYYECSSGDVVLRLGATAEKLPATSGDARIAAFRLAGRSYAVFAPTGASFEWRQANELVLHLPEAARYFSIAGLPESTTVSSEAMLRDFAAVAYAFPTSTRADGYYDVKTSKVRTTFTVSTTAKEGSNLTTYMGLYPHHSSALAGTPDTRYGYDSVRGTINLVKGNSFAVERSYTGFVPAWGGLEDGPGKESVDSLLVGDVAKFDQMYTRMGRGTYWYGKALGASAQLLSVAQAQGRTEMRDDLLAQLKKRLEYWFDGTHSSYFLEDARLGTFVGLPQEYNSVSNMNDHHFHYGYWIMAAAHVALRDPAWAANGQWGGIVEKIIADIATAERGRADFPFLRNYDPYEGHSWASGDADFVDGNNQESSSEAVNAWAGLILWGEATGNTRLRDLGVYLYTSEIASIQHYWFDPDRKVLAGDYGKPFASMVFGGKYAYNTWWTQEPRQILGINMLPITTASTYLGRNPSYMRGLIEGLPAEVKAYQARGMSDGTPDDIWQDVLCSTLALADPQAGAAAWKRKGSVEVGESRSHTAFWLASLQAMGTPDFSVTADTPLYAVFKAGDGRRTYLAYNAGSAPIRVTFSSGVSVDVAPRTLSRSR